MGRMKDNLSRRRGVYADALDDHTIAQCCLKPKPHQLHPDFRPALICAVELDLKRLKLHIAIATQKLPIVVRPPPPKSLATAPEKPD